LTNFKSREKNLQGLFKELDHLLWPELSTFSKRTLGKRNKGSRIYFCENPVLDYNMYFSQAFENSRIAQRHESVRKKIFLLTF
jgi:hypothetical protein